MALTTVKNGPDAYFMPPQFPLFFFFVLFLFSPYFFDNLLTREPIKIETLFVVGKITYLHNNNKKKLHSKLTQSMGIYFNSEKRDRIIRVIECISIGKTLCTIRKKKKKLTKLSQYNFSCRHHYRDRLDKLLRAWISKS